MVDQHIGLEETDDGIWASTSTPSSWRPSTSETTSLPANRSVPMFPDTSVSDQPGRSRLMAVAHAKPLLRSNMSVSRRRGRTVWSRASRKAPEQVARPGLAKHDEVLERAGALIGKAVPHSARSEDDRPRLHGGGVRFDKSASPAMRDEHDLIILAVRRCLCSSSERARRRSEASTRRCIGIDLGHNG